MKSNFKFLLITTLALLMTACTSESVPDVSDIHEYSNSDGVLQSIPSSINSSLEKVQEINKNLSMFDLGNRIVMLNSGYVMPING